MKNGLIHRNGEVSSKKVFFCVACAVATVILLWVTYHQHLEYGMTDEWFVALFMVYLVTVGGFEVIPKMLAMLIEFKNGKAPAKPEDVC